MDDFASCVGNESLKHVAPSSDVEPSDGISIVGGIELSNRTGGSSKAVATEESDIL